MSYLSTVHIGRVIACHGVSPKIAQLEPFGPGVSRFSVVPLTMDTCLQDIRKTCLNLFNVYINVLYVAVILLRLPIAYTSCESILAYIVGPLYMEAKERIEKDEEGIKEGGVMPSICWD